MIEGLSVHRVWGSEDQGWEWGEGLCLQAGTGTRPYGLGRAWWWGKVSQDMPRS